MFNRARIARYQKFHRLLLLCDGRLIVTRVLGSVERSELQTRIGTTENVSLCGQMKS